MAYCFYSRALGEYSKYIPTDATKLALKDGVIEAIYNISGFKENEFPTASQGKNENSSNGSKPNTIISNSSVNSNTFEKKSIASDKNAQNETEKYSLNGKGQGYVSYSMSVNARNAYQSGEKPMSKWNKTSVVFEIADSLGVEEEDISLKKPYKEYLSYSSWHHTSKKYNKTAFYDVNFSFRNIGTIELKENGKQKILSSLYANLETQNKKLIELENIFSPEKLLVKLSHVQSKIVCLLSNEIGAHYFLIFIRSVVSVGFYRGYFVNSVHTFNYSAKGGILTVQKNCVCVADKELR